MSNHVHAIMIALDDDIQCTLQSSEGDEVMDFRIEIGRHGHMKHELTLMFMTDDLPRMHELFDDLTRGLHEAMEETRPVMAIKLLGRKEGDTRPDAA